MASGRFKFSSRAHTHTHTPLPSSVTLIRTNSRKGTCLRQPRGESKGNIDDTQVDKHKIKFQVDRPPGVACTKRNRRRFAIMMEMA